MMHGQKNIKLVINV